MLRSTVEKYERLAVYIPLAGTALILVIQNFFQGFLRDISLNIAIAAISIAIILLIWYLEAQMNTLRLSFDKLSTQVERLAEQQPLLLREGSSNFQIVTLGDAFRSAAILAPRVQHLRIYSITSAQMVSFLEHSGIVVDRCSLLISRATSGQPLMEGQIEAALQGWRALVENGKINSLEVRRYDFYPTEYEAIFDSTFLIVGLFDPSPAQTSGARVRNPISVNAHSVAGAKFVSEFVERFDGLFQVCGVDALGIDRTVLRNPQANDFIE